MKVYVLTRFEPFGIEEYFAVFSSAKKAEKALRTEYPHCKTIVDGFNISFKDQDSNLLFRIREEEI